MGLLNAIPAEYFGALVIEINRTKHREQHDGCRCQDECSNN